jgi:hypothetical protein
MELSKEMQIIEQEFWNPFMEMTKNPGETQRSTLLEILRSNENSGFGIEHGFSKIHNHQDFVNSVAVHDYESLRAYLEANELTTERAIQYARTSGTTGRPKYIPLSDRRREEYRRSQSIAAYGQYKDIPGVFEGCGLVIVSPEVEGFHDSGIPYGSMSGIISKSLPESIQDRFVLSDNLIAIEDYETKYLLIAACALAEPNIAYLASANPSTFLKLVEVVGKRGVEILSMIATGDCGVEDVELEADPVRAAELKEVLGGNTKEMFSKIWPNLKAIMTWTSGNCSVLIPRLRDFISRDARIVEMGYLASEFCGSIVVDALENVAVPALHENFYEFVEKGAWEEGRQSYLLLEELEEGREYYVIVTTMAGLYRYFMDDIVRVTGRFNATPSIEFVQKGKGVTNITGEKLYERHVIEAINGVKVAHAVEIEFFVMFADLQQGHYVLNVEHPPVSRLDLAQCIEIELMRINIEYSEKRKSGRLGELRVSFLRPGTGEAYKKYCIGNGQRESQYKINHLQYRAQQVFDFGLYVY